MTKSRTFATVFFIVLDLRLTKVGVQRYSFFFALYFPPLKNRCTSAVPYICHTPFIPLIHIYTTIGSHLWLSTMVDSPFDSCQTSILQLSNVRFTVVVCFGHQKKASTIKSNLLSKPLKQYHSLPRFYINSLTSQ